MKIGGIYRDKNAGDRYVVLKELDEGLCQVKWLGDDGFPEYAKFISVYIKEDEYLGQASELTMALL